MNTFSKKNSQILAEILDKLNHNPSCFSFLPAGSQPVVIARGGYSGLFPDSSKDAITIAQTTSLPDVIFFCDLQLTKDDQGICLTSLELDNTTTIRDDFPDKQKSYNVNGQNVRGWFALDYTFQDLYKHVSCKSHNLSPFLPFFQCSKSPSLELISPRLSTRQRFNA